MKLVLASNSPRRRQLMGLAGFSCEVMATDVDETLGSGIGAGEAVLALAKKKSAAAVARLFASEPAEPVIVIAADTLVSLGGEILEKPNGRADAFRMLRALSGNRHTVFTGVCVARLEPGRGKVAETAFVESAGVEFRELSDADISAYIETGEPFDKAGAYGVQEKGALLVAGVFGDFYTVVGLPLCRLGQELAKMGAGLWKA